MYMLIHCVVMLAVRVKIRAWIWYYSDKRPDVTKHQHIMAGENVIHLRKNMSKDHLR